MLWMECDAASVINFFVSLGGGGSAAYNYMPLVLVGRSLTGRMTVTLYWRPESISSGTSVA